MDEVIQTRINEIRLMAHRLGEKFPKTKQPEHMWYSDDVRFLLAQIDACEKDNARLRERNSNLSSAVGISRAQNIIMREALMKISERDTGHPTCGDDDGDWLAEIAQKALERIDKAMASINCKHHNVKVDRQTDTYICRDCNLPLDEATKEKVRDVVENGGLNG